MASATTLTTPEDQVRTHTHTLRHLVKRKECLVTIG